jgi:hypothetical protein
MSNKININIELDLFNSTDDLNYETQNLMKIAQKVRLKAYAPYSNFLVVLHYYLKMVR